MTPICSNISIAARRAAFPNRCACALPKSPAPTRPISSTRRFACSAAGGGSVPDEASGSRDSLAFPPALLRRITAAPAGGLKLLSISGDSMSPTLEDGDLVMVDTQRRMPSPPGIFILDDGVGLVAKRVDAIPNSWPLALRLSSDNPAYSNYRRQVDEVHIVGRVVWFARSI